MSEKYELDKASDESIYVNKLNAIEKFPLDDYITRIETNSNTESSGFWPMLDTKQGIDSSKNTNKSSKLDSKLKLFSMTRKSSLPSTLNNKQFMPYVEDDEKNNNNSENVSSSVLVATKELISLYEKENGVDTKLENKSKKACDSSEAVGSKTIYSFNSKSMSEQRRPSAPVMNSNNEFVDRLKILSVTEDHSKDYSSSESNEDGETTMAAAAKAEGAAKTSNSRNANDSSIIAPLVELKQDSAEPQLSDVNGNHLTCDMSIFNLLDTTSRKFVLKPATMALTIKCQIYRQKGLYPKYRFYLENLVDGNLILLMTARKRRKAKTACYEINSLVFDFNDTQNYKEIPLAKLKSNLLGEQQQQQC
jgi:hypothetical protein